MMFFLCFGPISCPPPQPQLPLNLLEKALSHHVINEDNTDIWLARQSRCGSVMEPHMIDGIIKKRCKLI